MLRPLQHTSLTALGKGTSAELGHFCSTCSTPTAHGCFCSGCSTPATHGRFCNVVAQPPPLVMSTFPSLLVCFLIEFKFPRSAVSFKILQTITEIALLSDILEARGSHTSSSDQDEHLALVFLGVHASLQCPPPPPGRPPHFFLQPSFKDTGHSGLGAHPAPF